MDFELTEEKKSIKALTRQFCKREIDHSRIRKIIEAVENCSNAEEMRNLMPWDLQEKAHEVGLRQLPVPERYGGGGAGWVTKLVAAEELGYSGGAAGRWIVFPWLPLQGIALCAPKQEQDDFFSEYMENPRFIPAGAITEPQGLTDIILGWDEPPGTTLKTFAYRDGDEWVINGDKMFCSGGAIADLITVTCRTDRKRPLREARADIWVRRGTPGMTMTTNPMMSYDIVAPVQIHFDNVRVPATALRHEEVPGSFNVRPAKLITWGHFLGWSQAVYESIRDYAKTRIGGGKPIIEHPNIAALVAEAFVNLEATRLLFYKGAWEYELEEKKVGKGNVSEFWRAITDYYYKRMSLRLCDIGAQVYAGVATSKDLPLEGYIRATYGFLHGGSTPNMQLIRAASHL